MACEATAIVCPQCGFIEKHWPPAIPLYPWRLENRAAVADYVGSLADETEEWLLALYVAEDMRLLSVETIGRGTATECPVDVRKIILRGLSLTASGFFLVHNHPSGDPRASRSDRQVTLRIARISRELEMPLIEHFIVGADGMKPILLE